MCLFINCPFLVFTFIDGNNHYLVRSNSGGKNQSFVITVCHYERADQAGTYTPTSSPYIIELVFFVGEFYIERFCEVLAEKMRCPCLQRFSILHQSLNTVSVFSASETFAFGFQSLDYRQCHPVLREIGIYFQHLLRFGNGLLRSGMG